MTAFESFHCWRRGWGDAAKRTPKDKKLVGYVSRPDLVEAYLDGFNQGTEERTKAEAHACSKYGYTPSILRAFHTLDEPETGGEHDRTDSHSG